MIHITQVLYQKGHPQAIQNSKFKIQNSKLGKSLRTMISGVGRSNVNAGQRIAIVSDSVADERSSARDLCAIIAQGVDCGEQSGV